MGWIRIAKPAHHCSKPLNTNVPYGSIWGCDECGMQWKWTNRGWAPLLFKRRLKEKGV